MTEHDSPNIEPPHQSPIAIAETAIRETNEPPAFNFDC